MTIALPDDAHGRISADARERDLRSGPAGHGGRLRTRLGAFRRTDRFGGLALPVARQTADRGCRRAQCAFQRQDVLARPGGPRILTPHPGEFARLEQIDKVPLDQRSRWPGDWPSATGAVVVLKGHRTVVTDGERLALNTTGNPGMATGGTGDVLTASSRRWLRSSSISSTRPGWAFMCMGWPATWPRELGAGGHHRQRSDCASSAGAGPVRRMIQLGSRRSVFLSVATGRAGHGRPSLSGRGVASGGRFAAVVAVWTARSDGGCQPVPFDLELGGEDFFEQLDAPPGTPDVDIGILPGLDADFGRAAVVLHGQPLHLLAVAAVEPAGHAQDGGQLPHLGLIAPARAGGNCLCLRLDRRRGGSGRRWRSAPTRAAESRPAGC